MTSISCLQMIGEEEGTLELFGTIPHLMPNVETLYLRVTRGEGVHLQPLRGLTHLRHLELNNLDPDWGSLAQEVCPLHILSMPWQSRGHWVVAEVTLMASVHATLQKP